MNSIDIIQNIEGGLFTIKYLIDQHKLGKEKVFITVELKNLKPRIVEAITFEEKALICSSEEGVLDIYFFENIKKMEVPNLRTC
jgi:hypothetical protein